MTIPKTQKAAVFRQKGGPVRIEAVPVTQPEDLKVGEALVKVDYSGVCHTDLHAMLGDWPLPNKLPLIGGHEGAGTIVALGEHSDTDLKVGDRVGIKWIAHSCNKCVFCRQGYEPLCKSAQCSGFSVDGSFQQYAVSFTSQLSKIPDGLSLADAAPILCAGVTVYKALKESNAKPSEWIAIPGAGGGLGHLALQYADFMGLKTIAIDTGAEKKALCEKLGAAAWIDFKETSDIVKAIQDATPDGHGPHAAMVAAAGAAAYEQALEYVRPHGTVVAVGLPPDSKIQADVFFTVFFSKRIVGSYVGNRQDATEALEIAAMGRVKTLYKILPLSALPQVYDDMHSGTLTGRVVLDLNA
jgi:propanol-preferring alcohol dehydrogenase